MVHATPLFVNGGEPDELRCWNCGNSLLGERAVANTPSGPKFFCKSDGDPQNSCYLNWRRRQPRVS